MEDSKYLAQTSSEVSQVMKCWFELSTIYMKFSYLPIQ
jgi:hypothetical protein